MNADERGSKQAATRFKAGQSGNPAGRPKGARNKLSEEFLEALQADFAEHGKGAIERVRSDRPEVYLKVIASVVPKHLQVQNDGRRSANDYTDEELTQIINGTYGGILAYRTAH